MVDAMDAERIANRDVALLQVPMAGRVAQGATDGVSLPYFVDFPDAEGARAANDYLATLLLYGARPLTIKSYAQDILQWLRFTSAVDIAFDRATRTDYDDYLRYRQTHGKSGGNKRARAKTLGMQNGLTGKVRPHESNYANSTLNHARVVLHEWYEHLGETTGRPLVNPVPYASRQSRDAAREFRKTGRVAGPPRRIKSGRLPEPKRLPRYLSESQFMALWEQAGSARDRAILRTLVDCGPRASELLGMRANDINWGRALIRVRRKGGLKTDWIPAGTAAILEMRRYQAETGYEPVGDQPFWVALRGARRPLDYDALRAVFRRLNAALGTDWTPHDLRHTCAVWLLGAGMDIRKVQEILGHESIAATQVYTKVRLDDLIEAHARALAKPKPAPSLSDFSQRYDPSDLTILFGEEPT